MSLRMKPRKIYVNDIVWVNPVAAERMTREFSDDMFYYFVYLMHDADVDGVITKIDWGAEKLEIISDMTNCGILLDVSHGKSERLKINPDVLSFSVPMDEQRERVAQAGGRYIPLAFTIFTMLAYDDPLRLLPTFFHLIKMLHPKFNLFCDNPDEQDLSKVNALSFNDVVAQATKSRKQALVESDSYVATHSYQAEEDVCFALTRSAVSVEDCGEMKIFESNDDNMSGNIIFANPFLFVGCEKPYAEKITGLFPIII